MATNNFKAFALDPNANVTPQADWEALTALLSGFTAGKASSAQVNKALRQGTTIAALVGQFIANSGVDALDNGDVNGLVTKFTNALFQNMGFSGSFSTTQIVARIPFGTKKLVIQIFAVAPSTTSTTTNFNYPVVFPEYCAAIFGTYNSGSGNNYYTFGNKSASGASLQAFKGSDTAITGAGTATLLAIGY